MENASKLYQTRNNPLQVVGGWEVDREGSLERIRHIMRQAGTEESEVVAKALVEVCNEMQFARRRTALISSSMTALVIGVVGLGVSLYFCAYS